jgi:hypothetical protein
MKERDISMLGYSLQEDTLRIEKDSPRLRKTNLTNSKTINNDLADTQLTYPSLVQIKTLN